MESLPDAVITDPRPGQDSLDRKRELDIKEREVAAKEREVLAKEEELRRSRWLNPTVIGLFAAALGLLGSVIVARVNNANTQAVERLQSEANITLQAIKTGTGNTNDACKNLTFFVSLGLIHDPEGKIANQCRNAPAGPPSLPSSNEPAARSQNQELAGIVLDSSTRRPIADAEVSVEGTASTFTTASGEFRIILPGGQAAVAVRVTKDGYEPFLQFTLTGSPVAIELRPNPK